MQFCSQVKLTLSHTIHLISRVYIIILRVKQVVILLRLLINVVLACKYIGQSFTGLSVVTPFDMIVQNDVVTVYI
jgi:hypothetical protein